MLQHAKPLDISKILLVAESLESTVCGCFGPEGGHVLFIKSTGELIITKDGKKILEYLLLDHPVARMIVNSASKHSSITGDGVKSFVLLLCALLREIQRTTAEHSTVKLTYKSNNQVLRRISNMLLTFQSTVLEPIIKQSLRAHYHSLYTNMEGNVSMCRSSLQQALDTYFCGRIAYNNQGFISRLACDYLYEYSADNILEAVSFVDRCFSELHTQAPGFPVDNSRILAGLVLHREFSSYCPVEGDLQALIVADQIHQSLSMSGIGFVVSSDTQLQLSQQKLEQRTESIIKQMQKNEIKLLLSGVKQHEIVIFYAKLHGISVVECLPSEEIDLLCAVTGVTPMSTPYTDPLQEYTFLVKTCQPVLLGDKKYVQLVLSDSSAFKPQSIVLYSPVRGLTEQIASSFHGAFKMLKQLLQPLDASWEQPLNSPDLPNGRGPVEAHLQIPNQYTPMKSTHNVSEELSELTLRESEDSLRSRPLCLNCQRQRLQQAQEADPTHRLKCSNLYSSTEIPTYIAVHKHDILSANIGLVLQSGGVFEILLHHHLHYFSKTCQEAELAMICNMFGEALLCIPKRIYQEQMGRACFPLVYQQCIDALNSKEPKDKTHTGLESVLCKYQLLASVIQCICKLVTIDFIIDVKKAPESGKEADDV